MEIQNSQKSIKLLQRENCFKHSIQMAFQDLISWPTLISILEDMTPTFVECKQLVKVLLNELQTLKQQKKVGNMQEIQSMNNQEFDQDKNSDDVEILEEESNIEMQLVQDTAAKDFEYEVQENLDENCIEIKGDPAFDSQNFDESYTFVGSDHENDTSEILEIDSRSPRKSEAANEIPLEESYNARNMSRISKLKHEAKIWECKLCKKRFSRSDHLKVHESVHTGAKPHECQTCKKSFSTESYLKVHQRIHSGAKPFECNTCNKMFARLDTLKNHERTHTGEKPFKCKQCKMTFAQKKYLENHERTHNGVKPYECKHCKKSFAQLSTQIRHERIHTGEVPYECLHCGKNFMSSSELHAHKIIHSDLTPFECKDCGKKFKSRNLLRGHMKTHKRK